jgi:intracellular sulfur oxidation DsrE/DsrF family protein
MAALIGRMRMRNTVAVLAVAAVAGLAAPAFAQGDKGGPVRVVYHVNEGNAQAQNAIRNIRNHLTADPSAKIVVVTHAAGVRFLLEGAIDGNGAPFDAAVQELEAKGVDFRVCRFTLERNNIDPGKVLPEATLVPSGVAEVSRLQFKEGFAYLRP